jgi:hypothetical protein
MSQIIWRHQKKSTHVHRAPSSINVKSTKMSQEEEIMGETEPAVEFEHDSIEKGNMFGSHLNITTQGRMPLRELVGSLQLEMLKGMDRIKKRGMYDRPQIMW